MTVSAPPERAVWALDSLLCRAASRSVPCIEFSARPAASATAGSGTAVPLTLFAVLVAMSRVILGLHYPTDVVAGAVLGAMLGAGSLWLDPVLAAALAAA